MVTMQKRATALKNETLAPLNPYHPITGVTKE